MEDGDAELAIFVDVWVKEGADEAEFYRLRSRVSHAATFLEVGGVMMVMGARTHLEESTGSYSGIS